MNAIGKAVDDIKFGIPNMILEKAFGGSEFVTIDNAIIMKVIRRRVLVDINLIGGESIIVNITNCRFVKVGDDLVVTIPKELTKNRKMINALSLLNTPHRSHRGNYVPQTGLQHTTGMNTEMNKVIDSIATMPVVQTSDVELVASEKVLIRDMDFFVNDVTMTVVIENDKELNNLDRKSYMAFSKLTKLAVEAYIYNELRVSVEKGSLYSGHELSVLKDTVNEYADSLEMYEEFLKDKWPKISFMNDKKRMMKFTKSTIVF